MTGTLVQQRTQRQSRFALQFFAVAMASFAVAGGLAFALVHMLGPAGAPGEIRFPAVFWLSSGLLVVGSGALQRAIGQVRLEHQGPFRRALFVALGAGTLFVGLQTYGLWCLVHQQIPEQAQTGANAFITVLTALHGLHFTVALLFVVYVSLKAISDRYDHEYYWGVSVCAWFWHFLGVVWLGILSVFAIAVCMQ